MPTALRLLPLLVLLFSLNARAQREPASTPEAPSSVAKGDPQPASTTRTLPNPPTYMESKRPKPGESVPYAGGPIPEGATIETRARRGLIVGGIPVLGAGHVPAFLLSGLQSTISEGEALGTRRTDTSGRETACQLIHSIGMLPIGGAVTSGTLQVFARCNTIFTSHMQAFGFGLLSSAVQTAGLVMLISGITGREEYLVSDERTASTASSWTIVAGPSVTPNGLSIAGRF